jgi:hypothetical protein
MRAITTKEILKIVTDYKNGIKVKRTDKIFYRGLEGTLDSKLMVLLTHQELSEYSKCSNDIYYFIEKYCNIELRSYQKEWVSSFIDNRFNIFCISRQVGYQQVMSLVYLHYLIFNIDKRISIVCFRSDIGQEFLSKLYKVYLILPWFLKPGIRLHNMNKIEFSNGSSLYTKSNSKNVDLENTDILSYLDFSYIPPNLLKYDSEFIKMTEKVNSRISIQSQPNGINKFYELLINSERKDNDPKKNIYKSIRTYWWEVDGRDEEWKKNTISDIGGLDAFNQEYDLQFTEKR